MALQISKATVLSGATVINNQIIANYQAQIQDDGQVSISQNANNGDLYNSNKDTVRTDFNDFVQQANDIADVQTKTK